MPPLLFLSGFFAAVSLLSVCVTLWDKAAARRRRRRIPEATLLLLAALGGALCMYLTMKAIRHKTLHKRFMVGLPVLFVLQLLLFVACWRVLL